MSLSSNLRTRTSVSLSAACTEPTDTAPASTGRHGTAGSSYGGPATSNMPLPYRTRASGRRQGTEDTWDMAGQAPRGSRGHGRSSRPGSSSPRARRPPWHGRGRVSTTAIVHRPSEPPATPTPATRAVYRLLLMKGLTPTEAASLTAFICGLPTSDLHWSVEQVNQLLFLRRMRQLGRFGDGRGRRPD